MSKVSYPAVFHKENVGYWVEFPDLPGCFTQGDTLEESFRMAIDALVLYLDKNDELFDRIIPQPSPADTVISNYPDERVMLVPVDSLEYARQYKTKAVKKTLSIPEWLNDLAMKENISFSSVLQEALIEKLLHK